jgi:hypothetical protein
MWNLNDLIKIKYLRPYIYFVEFDDRAKGEVDLRYILDKGPVFKPLHNIKLFRSAKIQGGTIAWPNGADLAPETIYEAIQKPPNNSFKPTRAHPARAA